ncbi:hypothetical protein [Streptomyces sp. NPDC094149]|uniref:hypothetical protein n=1 Tax=Streptomyces sp. NPDC094149 TaxID=3155079 RepID=UPI003328C037
MGHDELGQNTLALRGWGEGEQRKASVHVADRIAAEHPHPLDDQMPKLAGRLIGRDPVVAAGVLELLEALGLRPTKREAP